MVNHMSRSNALVVSQAAIAKGIGAKRESVNRAVRYLVEHNFIQVIKAAGASVYVVNSRVMWQGNRGNAMQPSALTSWPSKASKIRRPSSRPRRSSASLDWLKANGCWWAMNRSTHPIRASSNCRDGGPPVQARRCPAGGGQAKPPRCRWQPAGGSRRVDPASPEQSDRRGDSSMGGKPRPVWRNARPPGFYGRRRAGCGVDCKASKATSRNRGDLRRQHDRAVKGGKGGRRPTQPAKRRQARSASP